METIRARTQLKRQADADEECGDKVQVYVGDGPYNGRGGGGLYHQRHDGAKQREWIKKKKQKRETSERVTVEVQKALDTCIHKGPHLRLFRAVLCLRLSLLFFRIHPSGALVEYSKVH